MPKPVLVALVLVLALAGCSRGGDESDGAATTAQPTTPEAVPATTAEDAEEEEQEVEEPDELFTKAELPQMALQPRDAPEGWTYTKAESGPLTPQDAGIVLDDQLAQVRNLGLIGIRDAIFDTANPEQRLSTRVWLFARARGADRWLEKSRNDLALFQFDEFDAPQLADDSWAARGEVDGNKLISHGFRLANAVIVVTLSSQRITPAEADAYAAAERALARARSAHDTAN